MSLIGYDRISTVERRQILDRQLDALHAAGCERVFEEHGSGADPDRPILAACLDHLRQGDVLAVLDLDLDLSTNGRPAALKGEPDRTTRSLRQSIGRVSLRQHCGVGAAGTAEASCTGYPERHAYIEPLDGPSRPVSRTS